jgi:hypothetical protein
VLGYLPIDTFILVTEFFIASPRRAALRNKNLYMPGHAVTSAVVWVTMKEANSIWSIYILDGSNFRRRLL